ncbi:glycosyltransferase family 2 protein [Rudanella lutea]|uniref:glycosyltransferase family 2 protein n=1 Tax=Rudanella lutea TaxID=451374 RepID=UPI0003693066|nr:glycosyltransferase family 2 protein [Rudanella lutea]
MKPHTGPTLTILIVSYKSIDDLKRCLPSIYHQPNSAKFEVLIVDNYPFDGVKSWLAHTYPDARYIPNPTNSGYAGGNNLGLQQAAGEWVLFLNPDTELGANAISYLLETARLYPKAFLNPKLLNPNGTINACGNQMHYTGITTCRAINEPGSTHNTLEEVPLLSGAALMAPTEAVRELGGFNEAHFMYFEDADLSLRARLAGYALLCDGRSVITHYYRLGMTPTKFYYLERNRVLTLLRTLSATTRQRMLPALLLTELLTWLFAFRGIPYLKSRARAYRWLWSNREWIGKQNRQIQATRQISDADLLASASTRLPVDQLSSGAVSKLANQLLTAIYSWLRPTQLTTKP